MELSSWSLTLLSFQFAICNVMNLTAIEGGGFKRYLGIRISCDGFPVILSDVRGSQNALMPETYIVYVQIFA